MNEHFFIYNGFLFRSGRPVISPDHPSFSYGDGLFETMRMHKGQVINSQLHFERLKNGMDTLQYQITPNFFKNIRENIRVLIQKNEQHKNARIRVSVSRSSSPFLMENYGVDYLIETANIETPSFDINGIHAVIYKDATKGTGALANLKSKNYLLSILAYRYANSKGADDGIVLNALGRICESGIANIYFVEGGKIFTPALAEGCVAGTVRQWLLNQNGDLAMSISETECSIERIMEAEEVFISNAIKWIQPVRSIGKKLYPIHISESIFQIMETSLL